MILYFSGTGNSKHIAELLSNKTGDTLYSINDAIKNNTYPSSFEDETVIFCTPTYCWRLPRVVSDWIKKGEMFSNKKAYFFMTCGEDNGNAEKYIKKLCKQRNMTFMGLSQIVMPENYIAMYDCPSHPISVFIVRKADKKMEEMASIIQSNENIPSKEVSMKDKLKSGIVNDFFYPFCVSAKKFKASDACVSCGKCVELCPLNNIHLKDGHPVWGKNCTHCMACICHCPVEAIEYGKISVGKRRYTCPK